MTGKKVFGKNSAEKLFFIKSGCRGKIFAEGKIERNIFGVGFFGKGRKGFFRKGKIGDYFLSVITIFGQTFSIRESSIMR